MSINSKIYSGISVSTSRSDMMVFYSLSFYIEEFGYKKGQAILHNNEELLQHIGLEK